MDNHSRFPGARCHIHTLVTGRPKRSRSCDGRNSAVPMLSPRPYKNAPQWKEVGDDQHDPMGKKGCIKQFGCFKDGGSKKVGQLSTVFQSSVEYELEGLLASSRC